MRDPCDEDPCLYLDESDEDALHDAIAAGYLNEDGSQPEPDEPDWGAEGAPC